MTRKGSTLIDVGLTEQTREPQDARTREAIGEIRARRAIVAWKRATLIYVRLTQGPSKPGCTGTGVAVC